MNWSFRCQQQAIIDEQSKVAEEQYSAFGKSLISHPMIDDLTQKGTCNWVSYISDRINCAVDNDIFCPCHLYVTPFFVRYMASPKQFEYRFKDYNVAALRRPDEGLFGEGVRKMKGVAWILIEQIVPAVINQLSNYNLSIRSAWLNYDSNEVRVRADVEFIVHINTYEFL